MSTRFEFGLLSVTVVAGLLLTAAARCDFEEECLLWRDAVGVGH